jgi:hypothetical protein
MHSLNYSHSEFYRSDIGILIGNYIGNTNLAPHPYVKILLSPKIWETRDQPGQGLSSSKERAWVGGSVILSLCMMT